MKESVLSLKKTKQPTTQYWLSYFQIACKYLKSFMNDLLKSINKDNFEEFGVWLQGYKIKFSCLYIPQGHDFMSTFWL